jgi:hypothetical protein
MSGTLYLLLGSPGTGKYTVGQEIVRQLEARREPARLVDNHSVANIVMNLIAEADGKSVLPEGLFGIVRDLNALVLRAVEELSPPDWSFVFTHHLVDDERNRSYVEELRQMAGRRGSQLVIVVLSCEWPELRQRISGPDRRARNKLTDADRGRAIMAEGTLKPKGFLTLDVTSCSPEHAAATILDR